MKVNSLPRGTSSCKGCSRQRDHSFWPSVTNGAAMKRNHDNFLQSLREGTPFGPPRRDHNASWSVRPDDAVLERLRTANRRTRSLLRAAAVAVEVKCAQKALRYTRFAWRMMRVSLYRDDATPL